MSEMELPPAVDESEPKKAIISSGNPEIDKRCVDMGKFQSGRTESPYGYKGLEKIDREECQCPGVHILAKNAFGDIAKKDENIDKDEAHECIDHGWDYNLFKVNIFWV